MVWCLICTLTKGGGKAETKYFCRSCAVSTRPAWEHWGHREQGFVSLLICVGTSAGASVSSDIIYLPSSTFSVKPCHSGSWGLIFTAQAKGCSPWIYPLEKSQTTSPGQHRAPYPAYFLQKAIQGLLSVTLPDCNWKRS